MFDLALTPTLLRRRYRAARAMAEYVISDKAGSLRYRTTFQGLQFVFAQTELNPNQLPQASVIQMR